MFTDRYFAKRRAKRAQATDPKTEVEPSAKAGDRPAEIATETSPKPKASEAGRRGATDATRAEANDAVQRGPSVRRRNDSSPQSPGSASARTPPVLDTASPSSSTARAGASEATDEGPTAEGLSLDEYARANSMTETEVWRRLRRGELVGRTHRGRLTVFSSQAAAEAAADDVAASQGQKAETQRASQVGASGRGAAPKTGTRVGHAGATARSTDEPDLGASSLDDLTRASNPDEALLEDLHRQLSDDSPRANAPLPPLPDDIDHAGFGQDARVGASATGGHAAGGFLTLAGDRAHSPELALLLDHLSLAKEENREILRLTQDSIRKVTQLTDTIVEMKDAVIEAKDTQIVTLKDQLDAKEREIRKLLQQQEDLEMLARSMADPR